MRLRACVDVGRQVVVLAGQGLDRVDDDGRLVGVDPAGPPTPPGSRGTTPTLSRAGPRPSSADGSGASGVRARLRSRSPRYPHRPGWSRRWRGPAGPARSTARRPGPAPATPPAAPQRSSTTPAPRSDPPELRPPRGRTATLDAPRHHHRHRPHRRPLHRQRRPRRPRHRGGDRARRLPQELHNWSYVHGRESHGVSRTPVRNPWTTPPPHHPVDETRRATRSAASDQQRSASLCVEGVAGVSNGLSTDGLSGLAEPGVPQ